MCLEGHGHVEEVVRHLKLCGATGQDAAEVDGVEHQLGLDAFVHSVGTAHSIHGVPRGFGDGAAPTRVVAVEPAESAVLSGGATGAHRIEGIGIGFVPPLWQPELVDSIEQVRSDEAQHMARRLAAEEGIFAGTSTGANVIAALRIAETLPAGAQVVTIAVDSGLRYLSKEPYG